MLHRAGKITASVINNAVCTDINKLSQTFLEKVMQYSSPAQVPATEWGKSMEEKGKTSMLN